MIMTIGEDPYGRRFISMAGLGFDEHEQLATATFQAGLSAHVAIAHVLSDEAVHGRYDSNRGVMIVLDVSQIRALVEHFADPATPKTPEADAIFNRMIAVLGTFREDLL